MEVYFIFIIITTFFAFLPRSNRSIKILNYKQPFNPITISFLLAGMFIGYRDAFGIDDAMYIRTFNEIVTGKNVWRYIEVSFELICKFFFEIGMNYQAVFLFYSILGWLLISRAVCKLVPKKNQLLTFLVFLAFMFADLMTAMRQLLAIGLVLNAYCELKEEKKTRCIAYMILAVFIHKSSLIGIIYYLLLPVVKKLSHQKKTLILVICFVIQYIPFASGIVKLIDSFSFLQDNYYIRYFLSSGSSFLFTDPLGILAIITLCMTIYMMWTSKNCNYMYLTTEENIYPIDDLESLAFLYWSSLMILNQFGYIRRITYFIAIFMAQYISTISNRFSGRSRLLVKALLYVFFVLVFLYIISNYRVAGTSDAIYIPYTFNIDIFN